MRTDIVYTFVVFGVDIIIVFPVLLGGYLKGEHEFHLRKITWPLSESYFCLKIVGIGTTSKIYYDTVYNNNDKHLVVIHLILYTVFDYATKSVAVI
jgi:hypothetical protein